jgi:predicted O-linked N-acetylglucosamine transferase (SPINDLY family)
MDPGRLIFSDFADRLEYFHRCASCADVFLDNFLYAAGATGCDALYAGVPLITRPGRVRGWEIGVGIM